MTGQPPHDFTRKELTELDKYEKGATVYEIGEALGRRHTTIREWLRKLGTYRMVYKLRQSERDFSQVELAALRTYEDGASVAEIAQTLGHSVNTIYAWFDTLGIERRAYNVQPERQEPKCPRCGIILTEAPEGEGGECGWCLQEEDYLVKMWTNEDRAPGYVIDIPELVLVEMEG